MKTEIVKLNINDIYQFPDYPFSIRNDLNYKEFDGVITSFIDFKTGLVQQVNATNKKIFKKKLT